MTATGIVVLAHGSRGERGREGVYGALASISAGLKDLLPSAAEVVGASLQFNRPDLEEAVALLSQRGVDRIVIAPYFLFPGRHITEDIPQIVLKLRRTYPGIEFLVADNLGLNQSFVGLMADRIKSIAPDLSPRPQARPRHPVEQESMKIIDSLLPPLPGMSLEELAVVKRIVHAAGDTDVAGLVRFSNRAVDSGIAAISRGSPIYTDVRMLTAGIDRRLAGMFGCAVGCSLDEAATSPSGDGHGTRSAAAMANLGSRLSGAIVAIGNAPTALLALLDLIDSGVMPALVVGMPVGFVQAKESKQQLMGHAVPYITVVGTRGGSAMAAAATNALLRLAAERDESEKKIDSARGDVRAV